MNGKPGSKLKKAALIVTAVVACIGLSSADAARTSLADLQAQIADLQAQLTGIDTRVGSLESRSIITTSTGGYNIEFSNPGYPTGRSLSFIKQNSASRLRITYNDNTRVFMGTSEARWIVQLDDTDTDIRTTLYNSPSDNNIHRQSTLLGYLDGVGAGNHTIRIRVEGVSGQPWTGRLSSFLLQVEEMPSE